MEPSTRMNQSDYDSIAGAVREGLKRYPNCKIANCECNSVGGEWRAGCSCLCHMLLMDQLFGKDKWGFADFMQQAKKGLPDE